MMKEIKKINAKIKKLQKLKILISEQDKSNKIWEEAKYNPVFYRENEIL